MEISIFTKMICWMEEIPIAIEDVYKRQEYNKFGKHFLLVDTAGIRRKTKVHEDLEFYSVIRAIKSLEECDVCILMIDARTGVEAQDSNLFTLAIKKRKGVVLSLIHI